MTITGGYNTTGSNASLPSGAVSMFAGSAAPQGFLLCDGSAVSRTTYATLYSTIGTTYGTGDGNSTFNLPNLKGTVPVGVDTSQTEFNTLGKKGGEKTHTLSTAEMPVHAHFAAGSANTYTIYGGNLGNGPAAGSGYDTDMSTVSTSNAGGGTAHNNLQPYISLNFIIKI